MGVLNQHDPFLYLNGVLLMKKTLVALATLSAIGSALADVDVSGGIKLYGVLDQALMTQDWSSPQKTQAKIGRAHV